MDIWFQKPLQKNIGWAANKSLQQTLYFQVNIGIAMPLKIDKVSKQIIIKRRFGLKRDIIDFSDIVSISLDAVGCRDALIPNLAVKLKDETQIMYSNTFSAGNNIIKMAKGLSEQTGITLSDPYDFLLTKSNI